MKMYLSGPMRNVSSRSARAWRKKVASQFSGTVLDPRRHSYVEGHIDDNVLVHNDIQDIISCDLVFCRWKENVVSVGTTMELVYAHVYNKPVIVWSDTPEKDVSSWLRAHCIIFTTKFIEAISFANAMPMATYREMRRANKITYAGMYPLK